MSLRRMVMSRPPSSDTSPRRRLTRESIFEHVQPASQPVSADRIPGPRQAYPCGASCAGLHVLGPARSDALLPAGTGPLAARVLRGLGQLRGQTEPLGDQGAVAVDTGLCQ